MTETARKSAFDDIDKSQVYTPAEGKYIGTIPTNGAGVVHPRAVKRDHGNGQVRFALAERNEDGSSGRWVWTSLSTKNPDRVNDARFEGAKKGLGITSRTLKVFDKTIAFGDKRDWSTTDLTDFTAAMLERFAGMPVQYAIQHRLLKTGEPDFDPNGNQRYNVYIRSLA